METKLSFHSTSLSVVASRNLLSFSSLLSSFPFIHITHLLVQSAIEIEPFPFDEDDPETYVHLRDTYSLQDWRTIYSALPRLESVMLGPINGCESRLEELPALSALASEQVTAEDVVESTTAEQTILCPKLSKLTVMFWNPPLPDFDYRDEREPSTATSPSQQLLQPLTLQWIREFVMSRPHGCTPLEELVVDFCYCRKYGRLLCCGIDVALDEGRSVLENEIRSLSDLKLNIVAKIDRGLENTEQSWG